MSNERTNPEDQPGELAPLSTSIVQVKIGSREYPMVQSTRCGVCMHPGRFAIEEKVLLNFGNPAIVRFVSDQKVQKDDGTVEEWPPLTAIQIKHHRDAGHVAANMDMVNELAKRRAEQQGIDLENHTGQFVDHVVAQKIVLQRGMERLVKGEIEPDMKDLLNASKLLGDLEAAAEAHVSVEQYQELFMLFMRTTQSVVPKEQFQQILQVISTNPTFKAFRQKKTIEG